MKGMIRVTELQVGLNKNTGKKIVYPSLFDIFGKTREDLAFMVNVLYKNNFFNFSNCGEYAGYDDKYKMHYTFDDGQENLGWLLGMGKLVIKLREEHKMDVIIALNKSDVIESRDIMDLTEDLDKVKNQEKLCDTYIAYLKAAIKKNGLESAFRIPSKGKIYKEMISGYDDRYLYVSF